MHSSPPYPPLPPSPAEAPPFPYVGISALILIYVVLSYLIIDFIDGEEDSSTSSEIVPGSLGLSIQDLESLPWFDYEAKTTTNCAICLDWFQKGERCRSLPVCNHIFHAPCIDLWLLKRLTCPTCRSPFVIEKNEALELV